MNLEGTGQKRGRSVLIEGVRVDERIVDIAIDGCGEIVALGEGAGREFRGEAELVLEGNGDIAIPAFVNAHTHAAMTLLRGYADDMELHRWLTEKIWPLEARLTGEDVYHGTRLACLEMIRSGTVAFNDMYFFMKDAARAVVEMGLKAVLAYGFIDLFDESRREKEISATEEFCRWVKSLGEPRLKAAIGPHAPYTVSKEAMEWLARFASEERLLIHIHLSETEREVLDCERMHGLRPPALLDRLGLLGPSTIAAHCCWLDRAECELLGRRGVHVAHCPASNMKLAVGRAMPYHWLRESKVNVSLGTDGCASNNSLDMMKEMKFAALLQKFFWGSQTLLPAREALEIATACGALALRCGTGRLVPGGPADLVLIDRRSVCNTPLHNHSSNLVYSCGAGAVKTVLCNGRILMQDRCVPGEEEIRREAERAAEELLSRG